MDIHFGALFQRLVGAVITAASFAGLFWKLDDGISLEAKSALVSWLSNLKSMEFRLDAILMFESLINKVIGESHFSAKCIFRSLAVSVIFAVTIYTFLILNFGYKPLFLRTATKYSDFWLVCAITTTWNVITDYFSLSKTRIIIFYMSKKRRLISVISLHICDIVSTIIIFAIIFQIALQSVPQILLGAGLGYYYERDAAYNFYFGEAPEATLALFITTFFTSVWALMYALSLLTLRVIGHLKKHWICPYGYCRFRLTQFEP